MSPDRKIRFAVVGQGHIGKRHAEMIQRNPQAELVAVCDIRSAEECGINHPEIPFYRSIGELLDRVAALLQQELRALQIMYATRTPQPANDDDLPFSPN